MKVIDLVHRKKHPTQMRHLSLLRKARDVLRMSGCGSSCSEPESLCCFPLPYEPTYSSYAAADFLMT